MWCVIQKRMCLFATYGTLNFLVSGSILKWFFSAESLDPKGHVTKYSPLSFLLTTIRLYAELSLHFHQYLSHSNFVWRAGAAKVRYSRQKEEIIFGSCLAFFYSVRPATCLPLMSSRHGGEVTQARKQGKDLLSTAYVEKRKQARLLIKRPYQWVSCPARPGCKGCSTDREQGREKPQFLLEPK